MEKTNRKEITWNQLTKVAVLSSLILLCTITSFILIVLKIDKVNVTIQFVQANLKVLVTGTCALFVLLFYLMKSMVMTLIKENKE